MTIKINPLIVALSMTLVVVLLATMHIFQLIIYYEINDPKVFNFIKMVDFDYEGNLPSLYSSLAMIYCAALLCVIAIKHRRDGAAGQYHWVGLSVIFLLLGIDEGVGLHEEIGDLTENFVEVSGYLYFAWVIPYGIAFLVFCIAYLRFLIILPRKTAIQFVIAGVLYVTGALGIEVISAQEADAHGTKTVLYSTLYTIEELCEMFGVIVFAYALMRYIGDHIGPCNIVISNTESEQQAAE